MSAINKQEILKKLKDRATRQTISGKIKIQTNGYVLHKIRGCVCKMHLAWINSKLHLVQHSFSGVPSCFACVLHKKS